MNLTIYFALVITLYYPGIDIPQLYGIISALLVLFVGLSYYYYRQLMGTDTSVGNHSQ